jgi:hypothetical protein
MSDDLRARMRAVFAGKLSDSGKGALQGYNVDSVKETSRYSGPSVTQDLSNQINAVTRARAFSANNRDSQRENTCAVCGATDDLWTLDTPAGPVLVHQECARFLPRPELAEPSAGFQAASPDCSVTIIELPQAQRYRKTFAALQMKPPALVPVERWRLAVKDGSKFLALWGESAQRLGWTSADLFGLIEIPGHPSPSFNRLSRYDRLGLCWALQGRKVIALTASGATVRTATGATPIYYRHGRPALGPLGDSLDDLK